MGLFCLTPKNLIELNYTPSTSPSSYRDSSSEDLSVGTAGSNNSSSNPTNWQLPLPLQSQKRFYVKPKSNSLEGLPSLHKIPLSPRSQRPRSLDELGRPLPFPMYYKMENPGVTNSAGGSLSQSQPPAPQSVSMILSEHEEDNGKEEMSIEDMEGEISCGPIINENKEGEISSGPIIKENMNEEKMIRPIDVIQSQLSQQEAVRKKCSIEALINTDEDEDNYIFCKYPSRK